MTTCGESALHDPSMYPPTAPILPDALWHELAAENPLCSDKISPRDAADWFYLRSWPRFKTYPYGGSRSPDHLRQAILRWWARVDGEEILEARHLRQVKLGKAKPRRHRRPQPGSRELPQEPRYGLTGESSLRQVLRAVK